MPSYLSAFRVRITSTESLAVLGGMPWYPPQRQGIYGSAQVVPSPFRKCHFLIRSPPLAFSSRFENSVEWRHRIRPQNPRRSNVGRFRKWKKSHRKEIHYVCSFRVKWPGLRCFGCSCKTTIHEYLPSFTQQNYITLKFQFDTMFWSKGLHNKEMKFAPLTLCHFPPWSHLLYDTFHVAFQPLTTTKFQFYLYKVFLISFT